jgi:hypothetical protein
MAESTVPSRRPTLAAAATIVAAVVVLCCALLLLVSYLLHTERPLVGTPGPSAQSKASEFTILPHQRACMSSVTLVPNGRIVQLELGEASATRHRNPPIDVLLSAPGYSAIAHMPGGEPEGVVALPIQPPLRTVIGSACLVNLGTTPAVFFGSTEPRTRSRSTLTINGKPSTGDIGLSLLDNRSRSRLSRLGEVFDHASNLTDHLIPVWLIWLLTVSALLVVPVGVVAFFRQAVREDEVAQHGHS